MSRIAFSVQDTMIGQADIAANLKCLLLKDVCACSTVRKFAYLLHSGAKQTHHNIDHSLTISHTNCIFKPMLVTSPGSRFQDYDVAFTGGWMWRSIGMQLLNICTGLPAVLHTCRAASLGLQQWNSVCRQERGLLLQHGRQFTEPVNGALEIMMLKRIMKRVCCEFFRGWTVCKSKTHIWCDICWTAV